MKAIEEQADGDDNKMLAKEEGEKEKERKKEWEREREREDGKNKTPTSTKIEEAEQFWTEKEEKKRKWPDELDQVDWLCLILKTKFFAAERICFDYHWKSIIFQDLTVTFIRTTVDNGPAANATEDVMQIFD